MSAPHAPYPEATWSPPPPPPPRGPSTGRVLLGGLLVALGLVWLAEVTGLVDLRWQTVLSVAVLATGLALLATARSGRAGGLIPLGVVLAVLLVVTGSLPAAPFASGAGDREHRPGTVGQLEDRYELGAGTLELDLRDLDLPAGTTSVAVEVGLGEITVLVPEEADVVAEAEAGAGDLRLLGTRRDGVGPELTVSEPGSGSARLELDLSVGLGSIEVTR